MRNCEARLLGRVDYGEAFELQRQLVEQRKRGLIPDQFLLIEHPHTITLGRNGRLENLLAEDRALRAAGISFHHTDRGGDITYHGPGQIVGYPILDLRGWKRDVVAYVRGLEEVMIRTLAEFGIEGGRVCGCTGVWVDGRKIAAIGVHISRWVTSHGFALTVLRSTSIRSCAIFNTSFPAELRSPLLRWKHWVRAPSQRLSRGNSRRISGMSSDAK
jgi:lipoyl(octanoyl) transferase